MFGIVTSGIFQSAVISASDQPTGDCGLGVGCSLELRPLPSGKLELISASGGGVEKKMNRAETCAASPGFMEHPDDNYLVGTTDLVTLVGTLEDCRRECNLRADCGLFVHGESMGLLYCFIKRLDATFDPVNLVARPASFSSITTNVKVASRPGAKVTVTLVSVVGASRGSGLSMSAPFQASGFTFSGLELFTCSGLIESNIIRDAGTTGLAACCIGAPLWLRRHGRSISASCLGGVIKSRFGFVSMDFDPWPKHSQDDDFHALRGCIRQSSAKSLPSFRAISGSAGHLGGAGFVTTGTADQLPHSCRLGVLQLGLLLTLYGGADNRPR